MFLGYALWQLPSFIAAVLTWIKNVYYRRAADQTQVCPEHRIVVVGSNPVTSNPNQIENSAIKILEECSKHFEEKLNALHQDVEELKRRSENRNEYR